MVLLMGQWGVAMRDAGGDAPSSVLYYLDHGPKFFSHSPIILDKLTIAIKLARVRAKQWWLLDG
jgi:hypothetical protein